jgi:hypothetical protein
MIEKGKQAHHFFEKSHVGPDGKQVYRLKSMDQYMRVGYSFARCHSVSRTEACRFISGKQLQRVAFEEILSGNHFGRGHFKLSRHAKGAQRSGS